MSGATVRGRLHQRYLYVEGPRTQEFPPADDPVPPPTSDHVGLDSQSPDSPATAQIGHAVAGRVPSERRTSARGGKGRRVSGALASRVSPGSARAEPRDRAGLSGVRTAERGGFPFCVRHMRPAQNESRSSPGAGIPPSSPGASSFKLEPGPVRALERKEGGDPSGRGAAWTLCRGSRSAPEPRRGRNPILRCLPPRVHHKPRQRLPPPCNAPRLQRSLHRVQRDCMTPCQ